MKWEEQYFEMVTETADRAKNEMRRKVCEGTSEQMFLHYKPASAAGLWGQLALIPDSKTKIAVQNGWILATGEPLRINIPYDNYWEWIRARSRPLPIIGQKDRV
jgi:hypothetical protein